MMLCITLLLIACQVEIQLLEMLGRADRADAVVADPTTSADAAHFLRWMDTVAYDAIRTEMLL